MQTKDRIFVDEYTGGLVGPSQKMKGKIRNGGIIKAITAPGCLGPMITPSFRGGHEVTKPVAVNNAKVGDAVAITIESVKIISLATASGIMNSKSTYFGYDPGVDKKCPNCDKLWPKSEVQGIGEKSIRCSNCGEEASPFFFEQGYTIIFDADKTVGITVNKETATSIAKEAYEMSSLPDKSEQHPILLYHPSALEGILSRLRPFIGNIGTTPSIDMPDSRNAGDLGQKLIGAKHKYGLTEEELNKHRTDGHMDINSVRKGAVLICPVKIEGAGIYIGDVHANQGAGELAGHTTDVTAEVTLKVEVIKNLKLDGPLLVPNEEDLPLLSKTYTLQELLVGKELAAEYNTGLDVKVAPIQIIGTGVTLNSATENAITRAANLLDVTEAEIKNRATITGGVGVGRLPGTVYITILTSCGKLEELGLAKYARSPSSYSK